MVNPRAIIGGAIGSVYNISGWMLKLLNSGSKGKDEAGARQRFVSFNKVTADTAREDKMLVTYVIDDREFKADCLFRPGKKFFYFAMNVEALYLVNLTDSLASRYRGDLCTEIDKIVQTSSTLMSYFRACFPPGFTPHEQETMWKAYDSMLRKYGKMRAGDFVKSTKAASRLNTADGFSTRQAVKVAHMVAADDVKSSE